MTITIDNKVAALKVGSTFDFISENRAFSASDGYTLNMTLPLRGCPQNVAIFGNINRAEVSAGKVSFNCEIRHRDFVHFGTFTVTSVSESEVTGQFLEGKAELNFSEILENTKICDLDLGRPITTECSRVSHIDAWLGDKDAVALPWVNNASGILQNEPGNGDDQWADDTQAVGLSWMPYMIYLARKVCEAIGYAHDFSKWEESQWRWLLCCNALPAAWDTPDYADALPDWSVGEFFEQLELLLDGEFEFNYREKTVKFTFTSEIMEKATPVFLKNVTDDVSREISADDSKCEYIRMRNLSYEECDYGSMWNFYACPNKIARWGAKKAVEYETLDELLDYLRNHPNYSGDWGDDAKELLGVTDRPRNTPSFFFAKDTNTYFLLRTLRKTLLIERSDKPNFYRLEQELIQVNAFAPRIMNHDDTEADIELKIVPVWLDDTDEENGRCAFLPCSATDDGNVSDSDRNKTTGAKSRKEISDNSLPQSSEYGLIVADSTSDKGQVYDKIYAGFWHRTSAGKGSLFPIIDSPAIGHGFTRFDYPFSLSLNNRAFSTDGLPVIDTRQKFTFKFISNKIPNVRSIFYIKGKRYVCEKLTATFSEKGMSQLIKGEFYRIPDD